jgi:hypothetical protein
MCSITEVQDRPDVIMTRRHNFKTIVEMQINEISIQI